MRRRACPTSRSCRLRSCSSAPTSRSRSRRRRWRAATKDRPPADVPGERGSRRYYNEKYGKDKLHGVYVFGSDSKSARDSSFASLGGSRHRRRDIGIKSDEDFDVSGSATQSAYTPVVQEMKSNGSNYGQAIRSAHAMVLTAQGSDAAGPHRREGVGLRRAVATTKRFINAGGADVEGQYVDTLFLPFYSKADQKANPMLANSSSTRARTTLAGFGAYAWAAGIAFRDAVNAQVKAGGVNSVTRKTIFEQLNKINKFDAEGMIAPIDLAGRGARAAVLTGEEREYVRVSRPRRARSRARRTVGSCASSICSRATEHGSQPNGVRARPRRPGCRSPDRSERTTHDRTGGHPGSREPVVVELRRGQLRGARGVADRGRPLQLSNGQRCDRLRGVRTGGLQGSGRGHGLADRPPSSTARTRCVTTAPTCTWSSSAETRRRSRRTSSCPRSSAGSRRSRRRSSTEPFGVEDDALRISELEVVLDTMESKPFNER